MSLSLWSKFLRNVASAKIWRFNRFPPKGIFRFPRFFILDIYSKMTRARGCGGRSMETIVSSCRAVYCRLLQLECVMRLENTFCCFPSPQCMAALKLTEEKHGSSRLSKLAALPPISSHIIIFYAPWTVRLCWQALQFWFSPLPLRAGMDQWDVFG